MSIESRIESGLRAAVEAEPVGTPAPLSDVKTAARRQTRQERAAWWIGGAALTAAVVFLTIQARVEEPYIGAGENLLATDPVVVQGAPSPEPSFDTTNLGIETPLTPLTDSTRALALAVLLGLGASEDREIIRVTTIGITVGGIDSVILHANETGPSGRRLQIRCIIANGASCGGESIEYAANEPNGLLQPTSPNEPSIYGVGGADVLAWDVPPGTSVVVLTVNDESMWQRPIADVAVFDTVLFDGDRFQMAALDQQGTILSSFEIVARLG
jgi:hypothetical protein